VLFAIARFREPTEVQVLSTEGVTDTKSKTAPS